METEHAYWCDRCGERLNPSRIMWLELNTDTGRYSREDSVPSNKSQGCFPFGEQCALSVLKAGGRLQRIRNSA
jgi:hypothetical protein